MNPNPLERVYPSQLLNELHHYFPRLLYRSEEFQTVQDVLRYIIHVASESPYLRASANYLSSSPTHFRTMTGDSNVFVRQLPSETELSASIPAASVRIHPSNRRSTVLRPSTMSSSIFSTDTFTNTFADQFVTNLFSSMLGGNQQHGDLYFQILGNSIDPAPISATQQDLEQHTSLHTEPTDSEHICSICQDNYETQSSCRLLTYCGHRFHKNCIDIWLQSHITCPDCRHDIRQPNLPQ